MTYDEFLEQNRNILLGYYILDQWHPGKLKMGVPYPHYEVSDEDLEVLKEKLSECMPRESLILDLWDWDAHFEEDLEYDWYFEAIFGEEGTIEACAADLAEYFHEQVDHFGMDYNQHEDEEFFSEFVLQESINFIRKWRDQAFKRFTQKQNP